MIKIEIKPSQATALARSGISKKTGQPFTIHEQAAYAWLGDDYPQLFKFNLGDNQSPYQAGIYTIHDSCFYIGDFQKLTIGKVILIPFSEEKGK